MAASGGSRIARGRRGADIRRGAWLGGGFAEHFSNPSALDTIPHGLSTAALEIGAHAKGEELFDDLSLRTYRRCRTRSTTASVLHGEVKGCGPGFVLQRRVTAGSEKTSHRRSATRSDRAVQGSSAVLILQMDVGTFAEKVPDSFHLPFCIPCRAADETVRCVMQRAASAVVFRGVWVGASRQQYSSNLDTITGRGQVQGSISDVDPMKDL